MTSKKKRRLLFGTFGIIFTCIVICFFWLGNEPITQLITPKEETFTELYFEDHLRLPKILYRGIPSKISFTVHNMEGKDMLYPIKLLAIDDSDPPVITLMNETSVDLKAGQSITVPIQVALPLSTPDRQKVVIELMNINQSIHFWAQVSTPSAAQAAQLNQN